jgi:serine/threonine-protein kinase
MKECSKCKHCYDDEVEVCPLDGGPLVVTIAGPTTISGRYVLENRLGQGGMGIVFKAKHLFLKSAHAVKIILPSLVDDDENLLVRFRQEAILAASIDHPNVIRVTDFGVENGTMPFLVMEYVDGMALSHYLEEGKPLPLEQAFALFTPVAEGVAEAHSRGIVHRDLKPQNIMVQKNMPLRKAVKVLDFGLAKIKSADSYPSLIQAKTMSIVGSPPYMSPEQWSGEGVDNRTDIYALAVVLYQMLIGRLPFQADSMPAMMYQHLTVPPPSAESFGVTLPPGLEDILQKALQKDPNDRYATMDVMLGDLDVALGRSTSPGLTGAVTEVLIPRASIEASIPKPSLPNAELTESQKQRLNTFFDSGQAEGMNANPQLAQEFLEAQDRIASAKTEAVNADMLVQELALAQKEAEQAQERALDAKKRIEADVRRQVEAEMQRLAAEDQAKREAEADRLAKEVEARRAAEERANYLAQAALQAQQQAEAERRKREEEAQQRELQQGVRQKAEEEAQLLAAQVAEARRQYEEAKNQAAREAEYRAQLEAKQKKIESDLESLTYNEAERRKLVEAQAQQYIEEQAAKYESEAQAARQRLDEARALIDLEAEKRERAEAARLEAENEAARLSKEIIEVQRQMEEMRQHVTFDSQTGQIHSSSAPDSMRQTLSSLTSNTQISGQSSGRIPSGLLVTSETKKRSKLPALVGAAFVSFVLLAAGGIGLYFVAFRPTTPPVVQNTSPPPTNGNNKTSADVLKNFVLMPTGTFTMGRSDVVPTDQTWGSEFPAHEETVEAFYIAKFETTMGEYAEFVREKKRTPPKDWGGANPPAGKENFPVVNVSLADAKAYADWFSQKQGRVCRLPEETQWEYAARNKSQSTTYPWGNDPRPGAAVLSGQAAAVGTSKDETLDGIKDMLGNVSEWTATAFALYDKHPARSTSDTLTYVVRGLNYKPSKEQAARPEFQLSSRFDLAEEQTSELLGFRLVCAP